MNIEQQLEAARNVELNNYLSSLEPRCPSYDLEDEEPLPKFTTHKFTHELHGELLTCVMTLNDRDEEDVRCSWYTIGPEPVLKYTNETAPYDGIDRADVLAYNLWWDQQVYQRTLKAA